MLYNTSTNSELECVTVKYVFRTVPLFESPAIVFDYFPVNVKQLLELRRGEKYLAKIKHMDRISGLLADIRYQCIL